MKKQHELTAIIYDRKGRVLSVGKNNYHKSHPLMAHHANKVGLPEKNRIHAEFDAVIRLKDLSKAYHIAVFRYNKKGEPLLAKPCKICESLIASIPTIKKVTHT